MSFYDVTLSIKIVPMSGSSVVSNSFLKLKFISFSHSWIYIILVLVFVLLIKKEKMSEYGSNGNQADYPPSKMMILRDSILNFKHLED